MKAKIDGLEVEGTPEEIAKLLKLKENEKETKKKKYCSCYEEDSTGYVTTYHRVRNGCPECREY